MSVGPIVSAFLGPHVIVRLHIADYFRIGVFFDLVRVLLASNANRPE